MGSGLNRCARPLAAHQARIAALHPLRRLGVRQSEALNRRFGPDRRSVRSCNRHAISPAMRGK